MRKSIRSNAGWILCGIALLTIAPLRAAEIYINSTNDLKTRFNPGLFEVGDEIQLAGTERYMTHFDFEYWGTNTASPGNLTFSGSVQARIRFYQNNGPLFNGYATPGTVFWDSGLFNVTTPTARNTFNFDLGADNIPAAGLFIPASDITWSVQFQGMGASDSLGVDLYSPPVVGSSVPGTGFEQDWWQNSGSGWTLMSNGLQMNFGARILANATPVPEPGVLCFSFCGGIALFGLCRRFLGKA
jgi:hypothetical protein